MLQKLVFYINSILVVDEHFLHCFFISVHFLIC